MRQNEESVPEIPFVPAAGRGVALYLFVRHKEK